MSVPRARRADADSVISANLTHDQYRTTEALKYIGNLVRVTTLWPVHTHARLVDTYDLLSTTARRSNLRRALTRYNR